MNPQQVKLVYDQAPLIFINPLAVGFVAAVLAAEAPTALLVGWCLATIIVSIARYSVYVQYLRSDTQSNGDYWGRRYAFGAIAQGLVWGFGSVAVLYYASTASQGMVLLAVVCICACTIPMLAPVQSAYEGFLYSSTLPVLTWLLVDFRPVHAAYAVFAAFFIVACYRAAVHFRGLVVQSIQLQQEKTALAEDLSRSNEQLRRDLQERQRFEQVLTRRAAFERIITSLSSDFVRMDTAQIEAGIQVGLGTIGHFAQVDRSYVALFSGKPRRVEIRHEWCAKGVVPRLERSFEADDLPDVTRRLLAGETYFVPDVESLSEKAAAEQRYLRAEGVSAVILVPMRLGTEVRGFLGFDSRKPLQRWEDDTVALLRIAAETFINALERKQVENRLWFEAHHDPLTLLPNRRLFLSRLARAFDNHRHSRRFGAVMFFDLDDFKQINDRCGHRSGDLLLQAVAERLNMVKRDGDLAARLGGDEFVMIFNHLASTEPIAASVATGLGMRLKREIAKPCTIDGMEFKVFASLGIALFPTNEPDAEGVIARADKAMYEAKMRKDGIVLATAKAELH